MRIDFEKMGIRGTSIRSLELAELDGDASDAAAARVVAADMKVTHGFLLSRAHTAQLIADSITHVNDEPVVTPYVKWQKWNLRTREYVISAYNRINSTTEKELDDFFIKLGLDAPQPDPSASR